MALKQYTYLELQQNGPFLKKEKNISKVIDFKGIRTGYKQCTVVTRKYTIF